MKKSTIYTIILASISYSAHSQIQKTNVTPAQQLVANTGEDSLNSYGNNHSHTVISGYGELYYQRDFNNQKSTVDLKRAVIFVGHQFSGRIAFFSELEVEDAKVAAGGVTGEVGMEQAYMKFSLNPRQYLVAGLFVPRIGITNENHLPINYNGVERPLVEQMVIPSTWREIGVGFYGQTTSLPLTYSVALLNGLDNSAFQHGSGIKEGRQEGQNAGANNLAITAAVQYFAGNWKFQVSVYAGGSTTLAPKNADTLGLKSGALGTPIYLGEADLQYANNGLTFKVLATTISIPEASNINHVYTSNTPSQMYGVYAEAGYNLFQHSKSKQLNGKQLNIFARYEMLDMNAQIPTNGVNDGTLKQSHTVVGLCYLPIANVVIKADIRLLHTGDQNPLLVNPNSIPYKQNNSFLNIGIGYSF